VYSPTQSRFLLNEAVAGLVRRRVSGTVAVVIMASALMMLALFSLLTINLDRLLQSVRSGIDVTVYLTDDVTEAQRQMLHDDLMKIDGVLAVGFISREQALEQFRADLGEDAQLLAALEENPLPASFRLRLAPQLQRSEAVEKLCRNLQQYPGVEEAKAQVEWIRRLDRLTRVFVAVDVAIGVLVLLSALFVVSNTVKLTIEEGARRVEIMKLVGATNWFIRTPYLLNGALQGAAAGLLAMAVLTLVHRLLARQVGGIFFFAPDQVFGFVVLSTLLGTAGSFTALRRHLRL
jgi:cell division transport system permease protein